ncbi:integral membrane protein [Diaporthe amygdali]|uniref:uncharacterized protein n=1 Tax=Phomopsis amygdali TaxID=1214568 RepID=UPI0022FDCE46|nr:uncharacterized protein J7T55_013503 [Diaporthe amygdali]KAJ0119266.1 integral membrane protein [Diaporthe amygdali]
MSRLSRCGLPQQGPRNCQTDLCMPIEHYKACKGLEFTQGKTSRASKQMFADTPAHQAPVIRLVSTPAQQSGATIAPDRARPSLGILGRKNQFTTMADTNEPQPGPLNYIVGFTLVGIAWGLTTPFIRRAAKDHHPAPHPLLESDAVKASWLKSRVYGAFFAVLDLLRNPRYAVPLLLNLTGSVWFFLLIGKAELSLTVPIVNTLAFLFTVVGDWVLPQGFQDGDG